MNWRDLIFRLIVVAALLGAIIWLALHREFLQAAALERELERFGPWAPMLFAVFYAFATVLFVPGSVLTVAGGALFGPVWGTLWNLTGATMGATLAFVTARYVASDWVAARSGERLGRLMRGVEEEGWRFVAFVRLVPLFPFNLMNYAFGLTRIRLREYVLASLVCMAPGALAYTYLGYAGREAASGQAGAIGKALFALALLAAVAFLPRLVRRVKGLRFTDPGTLKRRLEHGEEVVMIDVRTADEFQGPLGHIAGATNIPIAELSAKIRELTEIKRRPMITI
jgi:uncharacterized membrane protein YdjX (TVP38/TMEM64 family)